MMNYIQNHWLELSAVVVSLISATVAIISWKLSKKDFSLTHRPFVWAENFGYIDDNNIMVRPAGEVLFKVINAPAFISKRTIIYSNKEGEIACLVDGDIVLYPTDKVQYTHMCLEVEKAIQDIKSKQIFREIIIEYSWLSSENNYFFESKWEYSFENKDWQLLSQKAT